MLSLDGKFGTACLGFAEDEPKYMGGRIQNFWDKYVTGKTAGWMALFTGILTLTTVALAYLGCQANQTSIEGQRAYVNFEKTPAFDNSLALVLPTRIFVLTEQRSGD